MRIDTIRHDPDLTIEERSRAETHLKTKYLKYLQEKLFQVKDLKIPYFIDTYNTTRRKILGNNAGQIRIYLKNSSELATFIQMLGSYFNVETIENMVNYLRYVPFEDVPLTLNNYCEGTVCYTLARWRLQVGI